MVVDLKKRRDFETIFLLCFFAAEDIAYRTVQFKPNSPLKTVLTSMHPSWGQRTAGRSVLLGRIVQLIAMTLYMKRHLKCQQWPTKLEDMDSALYYQIMLEENSRKAKYRRNWLDMTLVPALQATFGLERMSVEELFGRLLFEHVEEHVGDIPVYPGLGPRFTVEDIEEVYKHVPFSHAHDPKSIDLKRGYHFLGLHLIIPFLEFGSLSTCPFGLADRLYTIQNDSPLHKLFKEYDAKCRPGDATRRISPTASGTGYRLSLILTYLGLCLNEEYYMQRIIGMNPNYFACSGALAEVFQGHYFIHLSEMGQLIMDNLSVCPPGGIAPYRLWEVKHMREMQKLFLLDQDLREWELLESTRRRKRSFISNICENEPMQKKPLRF